MQLNQMSKAAELVTSVSKLFNMEAAEVIKRLAPEDLEGLATGEITQRQLSAFIQSLLARKAVRPIWRYPG